MTLLRDRTRRSLKSGDQFALRQNPGRTTAYWRSTFGSIERWHVVEQVWKTRQPISGFLVYKVRCATCGNVGTLYPEARMDIRREAR